MLHFALVGNPNSGKTTLFNSLTGSTAHVGNWPGVTVDKKEGLYKKADEDIFIVDLPGIYSLSPYSPEEVISRNYILDEKPDCIINIVDATNIERNLYLTTQLMEIDVPIIVALNMMDEVEKNGDKINVDELSKLLQIPVVSISALKEQNIDVLMKEAINTSKISRKPRTILEDNKLFHLVRDVTIALKGHKVDNPLFHAVKLVELDELEVKMHEDVITMVEEFKETYHNELFGNDFEAIVADSRYKFITSNLDKFCVRKRKEYEITSSDKIDKVLTHKWFGIPIFLLILLALFHFTFSENLFFLGSIFSFEGIESFSNSEFFAGSIFHEGGINSPGVILQSLMIGTTDWLSSIVSSLLESSPAWVSGLIVDGVLGGVFAVLSFVPQILLLFLFFSILEDSGYMSRVAFILDRIFRKFGLSGRAFIPMIMGFGCSVPAMINTRTLTDEKEKIATIRVIPFFSCGAKLPILTAIAGALVSYFNFPNQDLIVYSMYVLGMTVAITTIILMKKTTLKGEVAPFIMELPSYHLPQFKSLMIHLWDKLKHFIHKAFTIILASTIIIWVLSNFSWDWSYVGEVGMDKSILASIGKFIQPIFTPLGFGSQLKSFGWVFAVAAVTGLIAKENVVATFFTLACCIVSAANNGIIDPTIADLLLQAGEASSDGIFEVTAMIQATGIGWSGLISFIIFNMTTIPCFAAVGTARGELTRRQFHGTIIFWLVSSYIVSMIVYLFFLPFEFGANYLWYYLIILVVILLILLLIKFYNKIFSRKSV